MESLILGIPLSQIVCWIPGLPLLGAIINGLLSLFAVRRKRGVPRSLVSLFGVGFPLLAFGLALVVFFLFKEMAIGEKVGPLFPWMEVGRLKIEFSFFIDRLSLVMILVVTGVGSLIHLYSVGYMTEDPGFSRYFCYLNLFLFAMLLLVLGESLPVVFIGWEGVGLCSYLLIGFWFTDAEKATAGLKAFVVNRIGDAGFLIGMFLLFKAAGSLSFPVLASRTDLLAPVATIACLAFFAGVCGKSAQIPLYVWLPDAMAGPTPVSALIHAATMVTAGIYLISRLSFLYLLSPVAMNVVASVGAATALFAALIALTQRDIKKVLAYSTVSQLGIMVMGVGVGAFAAGIFHLMTHAFFKACLFLGAGSIIHALSGEQDLFKMGGLKGKMPVTFATFGMASLALAGIFPFAGFFSKDEILWQTFAQGHKILWGVGFLTAGLTSFYTCRALALAFLGKAREKFHPHESPLSMTLPLVFLGLLSLVGGWIGIPEALKGDNIFYQWIVPVFAYPSVVEGAGKGSHGLELILSVVTLLFAFHMGLVALILYSQKLGRVTQMARRFFWLHRFSENKFYIDEIYERLVLKPLLFISDKILWKGTDEKVIDGLMVNGSGQGVRLGGQILSLLQTGRLQNYALFFGIGAIVLIAYFVL
ncbi:MAG: NADH-quinone oxidoreductase subunit L [Deltaproteobacteria bacterium]|nr:NADH-quinone oxidoreductase subunit L [Deltaproteobacteria bacterium]